MLADEVGNGRPVCAYVLFVVFDLDADLFLDVDLTVEDRLVNDICYFVCVDGKLVIVVAFVSRDYLDLRAAEVGACGRRGLKDGLCVGRARRARACVGGGL